MPDCSLSGFQKLTRVEIEWKTLVMTKDNPVSMEEEDIELRQGSLYQKRDPRGPEQGIAALLPATIESLEIKDFAGSDLSPFLRLLEQRQNGEVVPDLRRLVIHMTIKSSSEDWLEELEG